MSEQITKFKQELFALLQKYDASIGFNLDGDTHGIYDEKFTVGFFNKSQGARFKTLDKEYTLIDGYSLDASDLKDFN